MDNPGATEKKMLSLDEMIAAPDVEYVEVEVPEWGGTLTFGSINAGAMIEYAEANNAGGVARGDAIVRLVVLSLVLPPNRTRVPKEDVARRVEEFKTKDVRVMNRLVDVVLPLNGVTKKPTELKNVLGEVQIVASPTA